MEKGPGLHIDTPKTFVVISSPSHQLATALSIILADSKERLREKFNGRRLPNWAAMTSHFPEGTNKEEILASADDILGNDRNFMMILSGYQNNKDWNDALTEIIRNNDLSATFLNHGGENAPSTLSKLFHAHAEVGPDAEAALQGAWDTVRLARQKSAVPIPKGGLRTASINLMN